MNDTDILSLGSSLKGLASSLTALYDHLENLSRVHAAVAEVEGTLDQRKGELQDVEKTISLSKGTFNELIREQQERLRALTADVDRAQADRKGLEEVGRRQREQLERSVVELREAHAAEAVSLKAEIASLRHTRDSIQTDLTKLRDRLK